MGSLAPLLAQIESARARISPYLPVTPLTHAGSLSDHCNRRIHIKWDNKMRTGSFKERGALNFLLSLTPAQLERGVCAASAGNHALALSYHAHRLKIPCHLVMPTLAPLVKVESCRKLGAHISHKANLYECLEYASELSAKEGFTYIPPYDHEWIVHGQGVAGLELLDQLDDFDSIVIPVGGGGYAAGVAAAVKAKRPDVYVLGICSEWAVQVRKNIQSRSTAIVPMTIADGIAVKTIGKVTGPILDQCLGSLAAVSEESIARAIIMLLEHEHAVVEGAGAAGLAGLIEGHLPEQYRKPVVMVCGSNIDTNLLTRLIEHDMAERGRLLRVRVMLPDKPGMLHTLTGIIAGQGANVLQVMHDRFYARLPGHVEITVMLEVRDRTHADEIVNHLVVAGLPTERC
jgi:threonine dehydratase